MIKRAWLKFGDVAHYADPTNPCTLAERATGSGRWEPGRDAGVVALCEQCVAHIAAQRAAKT